MLKRKSPAPTNLKTNGAKGNSDVVLSGLAWPDWVQCGIADAEEPGHLHGLGSAVELHHQPPHVAPKPSP